MSEKITNKTLSQKYQHSEAELSCRQIWEDQHTYQWQEDSQKEPFIVDTPPPTVSGSLHVGHVCSYSQADIITRYQRMIGKNVFYPMGWDDNGLPTERRVQNFFGIKCNPAIAAQENFDPAKIFPKGFNPKKDKYIEVARTDFIIACEILTAEDEKAYEETFRRLALSVDWRQTYSTINSHCRKISQTSFLDLAEKNEIFNIESPTMWDVDFQSAVAQAEVEDQERPGAYHNIEFAIQGDSHKLVIATTRPEMLAACISVVAHPEDKRYQHLFGKTAITPLFHAPVPILASEHADPEKGTGILMVCTFGDAADVDWWKQSNLPIKQLLNLKGCLRNIEFTEDAHSDNPFLSLNATVAKQSYTELAGMYVKKARKRIAELLAEPGSAVDLQGTALQGEIEPIQHTVKFYEKGDRPIEFIPTRQWFIKTLKHRDQLLAQGNKIKWHPEYMQTRYDNWVKGLNQDWCISRQRFFGVAFPVWYPIDQHGDINYDQPIYASKDQLPVDPYMDTPTGYQKDQRDQANGFTCDPDIMDTWATSSLSPQLSSHWAVDEERHKKLYPASIRPQAHEIIRTWAFYTIVKSWLHHQEIPWKDILLSGWVLDPKGKKMSKSKGNVITPASLFDEYSPDAIRYWAGRAKLGADTTTNESVFKNGGKLTTKIFNASKFVLMQFERLEININDYQLSDINAELDKALIHNLKKLIETTTSSFNDNDYATALRLTEDAFWDFCDNYLELVKVRSYLDEDCPERRSAMASLGIALKTFLKLFAPFMPYITEEVWQASFATSEHSIHAESWPQAKELAEVAQPTNPEAYTCATEVIGKIRGLKTKAQKSLKWEISKLNIACSLENQAALETVSSDLLSAANAIPEGLSFIASEISEGRAQVDIEFNENWSK